VIDDPARLLNVPELNLPNLKDVDRIGDSFEAAEPLPNQYETMARLVTGIEDAGFQ